MTIDLKKIEDEANFFVKYYKKEIADQLIVSDDEETDPDEYPGELRYKMVTKDDYYSLKFFMLQRSALGDHDIVYAIYSVTPKNANYSFDIGFGGYYNSWEGTDWGQATGPLVMYKQKIYAESGEFSINEVKDN